MMSLKILDGVPIYDRPFFYQWKFSFQDGNIIREYSSQNGTHRKLGRVRNYHNNVSPVKDVSWIPFTSALANKVNTNMGYRTTAVAEDLPTHKLDGDGRMPYVMRRIVAHNDRIIRVYMMGVHRTASTFTMIRDNGASKQISRRRFHNYAQT